MRILAGSMIVEVDESGLAGSVIVEVDERGLARKTREGV